MKYLSRVEGMKVYRLPDMSERVHIPMTGSSNIPGIGSHDQITLNHDLLFSPWMSAYPEMVRLVCQAKLKPLVLDLDDDIFTIANDSPNWKSWHQNDGKKSSVVEITQDAVDEGKYKREVSMGHTIVERAGRWFLVGPGINPIENVCEEIRAAALVTVSTERLKEVYGRFNPNIAVVPNGVDFEIWPANNVKNDGFIRLGLFGSNTHYRDWKEIAETLARILKEFPKVKLCFNSWYAVKEAYKQGARMDEMPLTPQFPDFFEELGLIEHPQVEIYGGTEINDWPKALANVGCDIGLAPLTNSAFNRGKSNLKYLEFSALRVPGVYEKLDPYQADVKHGENGFLASHPADWYSCIKRLIEDASLRKTMGNRAWSDVKARYDQKDISVRIAELYRPLKANGTEETTAERAKRMGLTLARA